MFHVWLIWAIKRIFRLFLWFYWAPWWTWISLTISMCSYYIRQTIHARRQMPWSLMVFVLTSPLPSDSSQTHTEKCLLAWSSNAKNHFSRSLFELCGQNNFEHDSSGLFIFLSSFFMIPSVLSLVVNVNCHNRLKWLIFACIEN